MRLTASLLAASTFSFAILTSCAQTAATGDSRSVSQPSTPSTCQTLSAQFSTSQRSSPPSSDDTSRIQSALTNCANTGKAVVLDASGSENAFFASQLNVTGEALVLGSGVTLYGSNSYTSQSELIYITGSNAGLYGPGTVDGRGDILSAGQSPRLVQTNGVNNLVIYNVTLAQAIHPNLYVEGGTGATIWGLTVRTPSNRANADGVDIDSIANVTVNQSSIEAGDDGIAIKTNSGAASNITVENTRVYGTHGLSIGSQTFKGVTNVLFNNDYVYGKDLSGNYSTDANAINIKTDYDCGGVVKQVTYKNICITEAKHLIILDTDYGSCSGSSGVPQYEDILIDGVTSTASQSGAYSTFRGYSSSYPEDVYLANIKLDSTTQSNDQYARVALQNSNITPSGTGVTTSSFSTSGSVPSCSF